jgi:hypothetical protein
MQRVTENRPNLPASLSTACNSSQVIDSRNFADKSPIINILAGKDGISTPPTN